MAALAKARWLLPQPDQTHIANSETAFGQSFCLASRPPNRLKKREGGSLNGCDRRIISNVVRWPMTPKPAAATGTAGGGGACKAPLPAPPPFTNRLSPAPPPPPPIPKLFVGDACGVGAARHTAEQRGQ